VKSKIFSIFFAVVLVVSFSLVMAVPAGAAGPGTPLNVIPFTLEAGGEGCTAQWVTAEKHTGSSSVRLCNPAGDFDANYAEVALPLAPGTPLSSIDMSITSFYCKTTSAWTPYFIFRFGDGTGINTDATAGAGYTTWAQYVASSTPQWQWPDGNWHSWDETLATYGATVVTTVLVELSGLPAGSYTAYVDDIEINGTTYYGLIQDAINAAQDGDTILVAAGTYNEDVTINKSLTLISTNGSASTTINGQSTGWTGAVKITANDVVFGGDGSGFTVNGAGQAAVYFAGGISGCSVVGNEIVAASAKNALVTEGGQSNHTISGNTFSGTPASQLVYVNGQASVHVASTNVDFIENTFSGTATGPALGQEATDSAISGNTFATVTGYAALELWGTGNTVTGNNFTADLPANGLYVLDNPGTLNIAAALIDNTFLRAVVVERSSLLPKIWANIQPAINAAGPADTVIVAAGIYPGDIRIGKALTVVSTDGAEETIIDGTGSYIVIISHSDVTFDGFTVTNPEYTGGADASGILVESVGGVPVSNVRILNNIVTQVRSETGTPSMFGATGINIGTHPLSDIVISGNTITNIKNPGGYPEGAQDHTCGINVWDGAEGVVIRKNTISDIKYNGIILEYANNVRIEENAITGCKTGIRVEPYEGATVSNVMVNLNNILGNVTYGVYNGSTGTLDATRNWWGAATGPHHPTLNPGVVANMGNAVSDDVVFSPWLYKTQETIVPTKEPAYAQSVVLDNFGAFAWNTFSAPIFLDGSADTWAELYNLTSLDYNTAYRFDLATQRFVNLTATDTYAINPGEGFFIKMNTAGSLPILYSTGVNLMPSSRPLTVDWNLIGLASMEDLEVRAALFSLAGDGQVVSPTGNIRPGAVPTGSMIYVGEGYWAYMLHERTLVGFTTTPVNWIP